MVTGAGGRVPAGLGLASPGEQQSPAASRRRVGAALVLVCAVALLFASRLRETEPPRAVLDLDQAWKVSLAHRLEHGEVAGRDFFYTYGPAAQVVTWVATRLHVARDPLASAPLADLLFVGLNLVLLALLLWVFDLGASGTALAFAVLAGARIPEHYASFRTLLVVLAALAAGAGLAGDGRLRRLALGAAAGGVAVVAQLVSGDLLVLAVLAIAGTLAIWVGLALAGDRRLGFPWTATLREFGPPAISVALASALTVAVGNLAIAALCAPGAGFFGYHRELVAMIGGYGLTMGYGWGLDAGRTLALGAAVVLLAAWSLRRAAPAPPRDRARLLALLAAAAVSARSAFTRSDVGHIALGLTPWVVLLAVLAGLELQRTGRLAARSLGVLVLLLAGWPFADLGGIARALGTPIHFAEVRERAAALRRAEVDRQAVLRRAPLRRGVPRRLGAIRAALHGDRLAVIPWENHLATALGTLPSGSILQAYAVHTPEAQERYLGALRAKPETQVLLAVDHLGTLPLDGVVTSARLPVLVRGLLEELEPVAPEQPAGAPFLLLERRPSPRRLRPTPLAIVARSARGGEERWELAAAPCRLLELELRLDYPPWVALGRPEPLELELSGENGTIVTTRVVPLRQGAPFEVLVPSISMERFAELWSEPRERGASVGAIRLRRVSELLGAAPSLFELQRVSCLEW